MRHLVLLAAFTLAGCASSPVSQCLNVSGTYTAAIDSTQRTIGSARLFFAEDADFKSITAMTIVQIGCSLKMRVTGDDGTSRDVVLDHDLQWSENGVSFKWNAHHNGPALAGPTSDTRTISLQLSAEGKSLIVRSAFDAHGLALLFVPFHDHQEASCTMTRTR